MSIRSRAASAFRSFAEVIDRTAVSMALLRDHTLTILSSSGASIGTVVRVRVAKLEIVVVVRHSPLNTEQTQTAAVAALHTLLNALRMQRISR